MFQAAKVVEKQTAERFVKEEMCVWQSAFNALLGSGGVALLFGLIQLCKTSQLFLFMSPIPP
jgi:hypothetical protein